MTGASATSLSSIFALSGEAERAALVVSIHDVAPGTQARAEKIISELAHHGVAVCSLLVVPNYHHLGCFTEDRAFVRWLQDLETKGHEIVIHGYFHERQRRSGESVSEKLFTRFYTKGEGEFYDPITTRPFAGSARRERNLRRPGSRPAVLLRQRGCWERRVNERPQMRSWSTPRA